MRLRQCLLVLPFVFAGCANRGAPSAKLSDAPVESAPTPAAIPAFSVPIPMPGPGVSPDVTAAAEPHDTEDYQRITDNPFQRAIQTPLSTFSIDVDTASYANVRRFLTDGKLPPVDAVRIEEMLNYFPYSYEAPSDAGPFSVNLETSQCPWKPEHRLVRIGLRGKQFDGEQRPAFNLTLLIDVSGSMDHPAKLPLLKQGLKRLVDQMTPQDRIAIVVYASAAGLVLPSTPGDQKDRIHSVLDRLSSGGSTAGASGIQLAYATAAENRIARGVNRVVLCTDGDFNVGTTSHAELTRMIEQKAATGVFLSVLGFGGGNLKDATMEQLADKGNGNYAYIDSVREAEKTLVEQMGGTLIAVAKDVKIQVEFNPNQVSAYRLIGYENRSLASQDFNDDTKDAGEMGAGHTVTALYELVPPGVPLDLPEIDSLKYQKSAAPDADADNSGELMTVKIRYKLPFGEESRKVELSVVDSGSELSSASEDFKFAAAVAGFGMLLRNSPYKGTANFDAIYDLAKQGIAADAGGYRSQFLELVATARSLHQKLANRD